MTQVASDSPQKTSGGDSHDHEISWTPQVSVRRIHHPNRDGWAARVTSLTVPGGRPFVLVAGIGVASDYFDRLAVDLNKAGSAHSFDLPGFGGVRHPRGKLGINEFADLVEQAIDEMSLENPVLIGHSMGTQVVVEVAARRPNLTSIILIGPVVNIKERKIARQGWRLAECVRHEPFAILAHVLGSYALCGPRWFFRVLPSMMSYTIEDRLAEVKAHTLILRGQFDSTCPRSWVEHLLDAAKNATAWEIPDAAHSVMYGHASEVAHLCLKQLERDKQSAEPQRGSGKIEIAKDPGASHHRSAAHTPWRLRLVGLRAAIAMSRGMILDNDELIAGAIRRQVEATDRAVKDSAAKDSASSPGDVSANSDSATSSEQSTAAN